MHTSVNTEVHGTVTTTNNTPQVLATYDLNNNPDCVVMFSAYAVARETSTRKSAAFEQHFAAAANPSDAEQVGSSLPSPTVLEKDEPVAWLNVCISIEFSGSEVRLMAKGINSHTLQWFGMLEAKVYYQP